MLQCIAVDDEPLALALLKNYISQVPYLQLAATCSDAFEASMLLQQHTVHLIFADIQMPGLTGLQFIESLPQRPMVIFITAYEKFALQGYNLDVIDYLVKPVQLDRFVKACNKAWELFQLKESRKSLEQAPGNTAAADYFFLNVDYSLVKIKFADVLWVEGFRDYVKIHLQGKAHPLVARISVKSIESELPPAKFIRIHKSYIIAVDSITAIRKNSLFINDTELPISETYREAITQLTGKRGE
ncbi:LytR/AlgR family response regulator transcription factor [Deminuibacter soli]|uniref:DNA-binding response regulator n=1 Tax=Deminuibacter soli TaxID=2291815 RepID=A0A3E1NJY1_9BACT|nr:LytTR family DNA-binding domain-containing protein [Deminuibacter soli]RFM28239.1 DNA-binding response regulator [Deminuibacter soli]